jgi:hypothetical protein
MRPAPSFSWRSLDRGWAVDHGGRTIAIVSPNGLVDWLAAVPAVAPPALERAGKGPHLGLVRGVKFELHVPHRTEARRIEATVEADGATLRIVAEGASDDGCWVSTTIADLRLADGAYRWELTSRLRNASGAHLAAASGGEGLEYNNVLPAGCFPGFLAPQGKRYSATLLTDRDGTCWRFPHQHLMHYTTSGHIPALAFAPGSVGGFFGEDGAVVVEVTRADAPPTWAICDMYWDLHCQALTAGTVAPGGEVRFDYRIRHLDAAESRRRLAASHPLAVDGRDRARFRGVAIAPGRNRLEHLVPIDTTSQLPALRLGHGRLWHPALTGVDGGAVELSGSGDRSSVWTLEPPQPLPSGHRLGVRARVQTTGECRARLRLIRRSWEWAPTAGFVIHERRESVDLAAAGWETIEVASVTAGADDRDHEMILELVATGAGSARFSAIELIP